MERRRSVVEKCFYFVDRTSEDPPKAVIKRVLTRRQESEDCRALYRTLFAAPALLIELHSSYRL
jgi:hypothetical protein